MGKPHACEAAPGPSVSRASGGLRPHMRARVHFACRRWCSFRDGGCSLQLPPSTCYDERVLGGLLFEGTDMATEQLRSACAHDDAQVALIANRMRRDVVEMLEAAGSGHPGGSLSAADIVATLFFSGVMGYDAQDARIRSAIASCSRRSCAPFCTRRSPDRVSRA